jgi:molybdopterin converting factor small subunit
VKGNTVRGARNRDCCAPVAPATLVDVNTVEVFVPGPLRRYCDGASRIRLPAATVRATLERLERDHPTLYRNVCDETGAVRQHINVFVNSDHMRDRDGLDTKVVAGDTIIILPAVSGG